MAPQATPLKVRPKLPILVGLGAVLILGAAAKARPREMPEPVRRVRTASPVGPATLPPSAELPPAIRNEPPPLPAEPSRIAAPLAPAGVEEDLRMLQEWILGLPTVDLRALDRSGELNRRLARIAAELAKRNAGELDRFLGQLNARLGVVPP